MTSYFLKQWIEARTRFSNQLVDLSENDLKKTLGDSPNSVGFLFRHIAEVELLFAKNVFKVDDIKVTAKTVIDGKDTGKWTDLSDLKDLQNYAFESLKQAISEQSETDWKKEITTKEFGTKTLAEAFGRVLSHTAYHAGQMAIINKYGKINQ